MQQAAILGMDQRVEEEGSHGELMEKTGLYHNLITKQNKSESIEQGDDELVLESLSEAVEDFSPAKELSMNITSSSK